MLLDQCSYGRIQGVDSEIEFKGFQPLQGAGSNSYGSKLTHGYPLAIGKREYKGCVYRNIHNKI